MSTQRERPGWLILARDVASYAIGVLLLAKQAGIYFTPPATTNETLTWIGALLIGVPGVAQIIALRFGGGSTVGRPSPPAEPAPQPPSPLPPASTSGGGER